jgi:hypothetical protein
MSTKSITIILISMMLTFGACGGMEGDSQRGTFQMPENVGKADSLYSCKGICGQKAPGGCYCDDLCDAYGDCCPDKAAECDGTPPPPPPPPAKEGESCGDDINVECDSGLYCAFGLTWCGTPPVTGICRKMGDCGTVEDCKNEDNWWVQPLCIGELTCENGTCGRDCGSPLTCDGAHWVQMGGCRNANNLVVDDDCCYDRCNKASAAYSKAVAAAKKCYPWVFAPQCTYPVQSGLLCGCTTYINTPATPEMNAAKDEYVNQAKCYDSPLMPMCAQCPPSISHGECDVSGQCTDVHEL